MISTRTPVVFIHDLWLHPASWHQWLGRFRDAGYAAVALRTAPPGGRDGTTAFASAWVSARWTVPGGRPRTDQIQVPDGTQRGSPVRVWVAGNGDRVAPPLPAAAVARLAGGAAFSAVTC